jgi:hypothetical protein
MQPIRLIYNKLPNSLVIPEELQNKSAEIIILPLESETEDAKNLKRPYAMAKGLFQVPPVFFEPLPESILSDFGIN